MITRKASDDGRVHKPSCWGPQKNTHLRLRAVPPPLVSRRYESAHTPAHSNPGAASPSWTRLSSSSSWSLACAVRHHRGHAQCRTANCESLAHTQPGVNTQNHRHSTSGGTQRTAPSVAHYRLDIMELLLMHREVVNEKCTACRSTQATRVQQSQRIHPHINRRPTSTHTRRRPFGPLHPPPMLRGSHPNDVLAGRILHHLSRTRSRNPQRHEQLNGGVVTRLDHEDLID